MLEERSQFRGSESLPALIGIPNSMPTEITSGCSKAMPKFIRKLNTEKQGAYLWMISFGVMFKKC